MIGASKLSHQRKKRLSFKTRDLSSNPRSLWQSERNAEHPSAQTSLFSPPPRSCGQRVAVGEGGSDLLDVVGPGELAPLQWMSPQVCVAQA